MFPLGAIQLTPTLACSTDARGMAAGTSLFVALIALVVGFALADAPWLART